MYNSKLQQGKEGMLTRDLCAKGTSERMTVAAEVPAQWEDVTKERRGLTGHQQSRLTEEESPTKEPPPIAVSP